MNLVIFDVDDTLVRSGSYEDQLFWQALSEVLGLEREPFDWANFTHVTDSGITSEVFRRQRGCDPSTDALAATERYFAGLWQAALSDWHQDDVEVPGARAMLDVLRDHAHWQVALATGAWGEAARAKLAAANILHDAFSLGCANDAMAREDIISIAWDRARTASGLDEFDRVVYVGDGAWDVKACRNLDLPLVGMAVTDETQKRLSSLGVSHILTDYTDTGRFFESLELATSPGAI